jgi:hypothetical protein
MRCPLLLAWLHCGQQGCCFSAFTPMSFNPVPSRQRGLGETSIFLETQKGRIESRHSSVGTFASGFQSFHSTPVERVLPRKKLGGGPQRQARPTGRKFVPEPKPFKRTGASIVLQINHMFCTLCHLGIPRIESPVTILDEKPRGLKSTPNCIVIFGCVFVDTLFFNFSISSLSVQRFSCYESLLDKKLP